ncbi:MAG: DUF1924 domain-containing protein [Gammaproteobacteria bacterium]|nr:DUF1924 domain-containing protein [Gammaproteobacteria bacterium]
MKKYIGLIVIIGLGCVSYAQANMDDLYKYYNPQGELTFGAERGKTLWHKKHLDKKGKERACTTCHGEDLRKSGKHAKTGKVIDPLAASVNKERFTDLKKVKKWFKRNCKWVLGRECTDQEKGDILKYLSQL